FDVATRYLTAAGELGGSSDVADVRRQLQEEMDRAARAQQAAEAPSPPPAPAPEAAPMPAPAAPAFIAASPVRPLDVGYPPLARGAEGHVIIEFTLHANGSATDLTVIEA